MLNRFYSVIISSISYIKITFFDQFQFVLLGLISIFFFFQEKREKELQKRYDELMQEKWNIGQALVRMDATITAQPVTYQ